MIGSFGPKLEPYEKTVMINKYLKKFNKKYITYLKNYVKIIYIVPS